MNIKASEYNLGSSSSFTYPVKIIFDLSYCLRVLSNSASKTFQLLPPSTRYKSSMLFFSIKVIKFLMAKIIFFLLPRVQSENTYFFFSSDLQGLKFSFTPRSVVFIFSALTNGKYFRTSNLVHSEFAK